MGRRKQWTSRPATGDLWTRHSVIALDPFVFEGSQRKRGGDGGGEDEEEGRRRRRGCSRAENGLQ